RFRAVDLDDAAARQAADPERDIQSERTRGNDLHVHRLHVLAEPHDRALAETALDLRQRGIEGFRFVHRRSFDETKCCTHYLALLMTGIRRARKVRPPPLACDNWQLRMCTLSVLGGHQTNQLLMVRRAR